MHSKVQSDLAYPVLFYPDPSPSGRKSFVTDLYCICHAYIQYVCSIIRFPRLSGYFRGKRMCAAKQGLTVTGGNKTMLPLPGYVLCVLPCLAVCVTLAMLSYCCGMLPGDFLEFVVLVRMCCLLPSCWPSVAHGDPAQLSHWPQELHCCLIDRSNCTAV